MTEDRFVTEPALWRSVGRAAVVGLLVGAALEVLGLLTHTATSPVLLFGLPLAAVVLLQLVRVSITDLPPPDRPQAAAGSPERFHQLRSLERKLDAASRDPATYDWSVRPMLAELSAERLYYRHGIRIENEPERARKIMGEQLWQILTTSPGTPIPPATPARLRELVQAISRI